MGRPLHVSCHDGGVVLGKLELVFILDTYCGGWEKKNDASLFQTGAIEATKLASEQLAPCNPPVSVCGDRGSFRFSGAPVRCRSLLLGGEGETPRRPPHWMCPRA